MGQCKMSTKYTSGYAWFEFAFMHDVWMIMVCKMLTFIKWHELRFGGRPLLVNGNARWNHSVEKWSTTLTACVYFENNPLKKFHQGRLLPTFLGEGSKENSLGSLLPRVTRRYLLSRFHWEKTYCRGLLGNLLPRSTRESTAEIQ